MNKQTLSTKTITPDKSATFVHHSDGKELIPSEIKSEFQSAENLDSGYRKDDEGIINNYAIEPAMSVATYPTPKEQTRYILWGTGAIVFVAVLMLIAFTVS